MLKVYILCAKDKQHSDEMLWLGRLVAVVETNYLATERNYGSGRKPCDV